MKWLTGVLVSAVVVCGSGVAMGQTAKWGARSISSLGDIRSGGGQTNFTQDYGGGAGIPIAESGVDDSVTPDAFTGEIWDRGMTRGFTGLTFAGNQPNPMRAEAVLTGSRSGDFRFGSFPAGASAWTGVFVSDLFVYTGSAPTTLSLSYQLDGLLADTGAYSTIADPLTRIHAQVAVFEDTPSYMFMDGIGTLLSEVGATLLETGGVPAMDLDTLLIDSDTNGQRVTRSTSVSFDVVPGQTFYVWQTLRASAAFGEREADAWGTLTASFDQPESVSSLSNVPEPSTVLLMLALILMGIGRSSDDEKSVIVEESR